VLCTATTEASFGKPAAVPVILTENKEQEKGAFFFFGGVFMSILGT
jgi:hypothetical protein